ncbi:DUF998 domain-containing protein [Micromonospora sp. NBC_01813]|uniref:DUF998 domain-containing protein n=1 Tax=Micromonospora sp. NBC_01813 TaxID=2975988 RepID=UPI002DD85D40|nr:DUF998 domain-containing protein [Micromonospora sp. NBC_01813]WSA08661.1 DUF998 domain-containing protein [Micromonospora sp. NBC_01813]
MTRTPASNTSTIIAGVALIAAGILFIIGEAVAAAGWPDDSYSYITNVISDLGVSSPAETNEGIWIHSPAAWAINSGWVINGALTLVAAIVFRRILRASRTGSWVFGLAIAYSAGLCVVATFHNAPAWMLPYHAIGAMVGMGGGNIAMFLTGLLLRKAKGYSLTSLYFTVAGIFGFSCLILTFVGPQDYVGLIERGAAYPFLIAQVVGGAVICRNATQLSVLRSPRSTVSALD